MRSGLIIALLLAIMTALFAVQNSQSTQISFLQWHFNGPLVVVLLITFLSGVITALLVTIPGSISKTMEISRLKGELAASPPTVKIIKEAEAAQTASAAELPQPVDQP